MYVSDPTVWRSFYENMIEGKFNPGQYRGRQRGGGGIAGMYANKPYMIPVNPHATQEPEEKVIVGKQVSPVTAVEERANSDLKDAIQDNKPHIPISLKGTNTIQQSVLILLLPKPHRHRRSVKKIRRTNSLYLIRSHAS